jgi:hypothetical protein
MDPDSTQGVLADVGNESIEAAPVEPSRILRSEVCGSHLLYVRRRVRLRFGTDGKGH